MKSRLIEYQAAFFFVPVSHFLRLQLPLCNFIPTFAKINWKD